MEHTEKFFIELLILNIVYFSTSSQSILLSIFLPQFELALAVTPLYILNISKFFIYFHNNVMD